MHESWHRTTSSRRFQLEVRSERDPGTNIYFIFCATPFLNEKTPADESMYNASTLGTCDIASQLLNAEPRFGELLLDEAGGNSLNDQPRTRYGSVDVFRPSINAPSCTEGLWESALTNAAATPSMSAPNSGTGIRGIGAQHKGKS